MHPAEGHDCVSHFSSEKTGLTGPPTHTVDVSAMLPEAARQIIAHKWRLFSSSSLIFKTAPLPQPFAGDTIQVALSLSFLH